jgi:TfoX/Sxy family transcriptional regulator of competence genes
MKEYVVVPLSLVASPKKLEPWVAKALAYGASLKPKAKKAKPKR